MRRSTLLVVGSWYTIGLCLGIGLGVGVVVTGIFGSNVLGVGAAAIAGAVIGAGIGVAIGDAAEVIAGGIGGFLGALSAAAVVHGALRRGGTRLGVAAFLGIIGALICFAALIPVAGYVEAVTIPVLAARMRGRQAARFAGLRTLAK